MFCIDCNTYTRLKAIPSTPSANMQLATTRTDLLCVYHCMIGTLINIVAWLIACSGATQGAAKLSVKVVFFGGFTGK